MSFWIGGTAVSLCMGGAVARWLGSTVAVLCLDSAAEGQHCIWTAQWHFILADQSYCV